MGRRPNDEKIEVVNIRMVKEPSLYSTEKIRSLKRRRSGMIMIEEEQKEAQSESATEVSGLDALREIINEIPDGTVYSIDLGVIEVGKET